MRVHAALICREGWQDGANVVSVATSKSELEGAPLCPGRESFWQVVQSKGQRVDRMVDHPSISHAATRRAVIGFSVRILVRPGRIFDRW